MSSSRPTMAGILSGRLPYGRVLGHKEFVGSGASRGPRSPRSRSSSQPFQRRPEGSPYLQCCSTAGSRGPSSARTTPGGTRSCTGGTRSEEHTSELQSHSDLVCRLLLEIKKKNIKISKQTHNKKA